MILLSSRYSSESARLLRDALCSEMNIDPRTFLVSTHPEKLRNAPAVRYGNSERPFPSDTMLNSPEFIRLTSNKKAFSDLMLANGVYSPLFQHIGQGDGYFPILVRETLTGAGGAGIHVVRSNQELNQYKVNRSWWWTPFINTDYECRVHVLGGDVVRIFRKEREEGLAEEEYPIRNNDRGYHFSLRSTEANPMITNLVLQIQPILPEGASFYALDLGWIRSENRYIVFEANSAPGLNDNTAQLYAEYIAEELIGRD